MRNTEPAPACCTRRSSSSRCPRLGSRRRLPRLLMSAASAGALALALVLSVGMAGGAVEAGTTATAAALDDVDGHYEDAPLTRLAFGSCNKQYRNQTLWDHIVAFRPQAWLWLGDAVYVKELKVEEANARSLRKAYDRQRQSVGYQQLLATGAVVEGVYDDHDMSTNDGHRVNYTPERQAAYLDFLGHVGPESPRRRRQGLYSSHVFGSGDRQVKVVFLDVRSLSDGPALVLPFGLGPFQPYLLALARWAAVIFGVTTRFQGDMLGEAQWAWLERQLAGSQAAAHIVVSSVQVLSTNPIVEGWGHYPASQARLLDLMRRHRPKGLLFLSGDVHFAELLSTQPAEGGEEGAAGAGPREALEVTSSGMTHTCFATTMGMCEMAVHRYNRHRLTPASFFGGLNYGTIEFEWEAPGGPAMTVAVRNRKGQPVLTTTRAIGSTDPLRPIGSPYTLVDNQDHYFFLVALSAVAALVLAVFALVRWLLLQRRRRRQQQQQQQQQQSARNGGGAGATNGRRKARKAD